MPSTGSRRQGTSTVSFSGSGLSGTYLLINYAKSTGKVRRNITKARILTAQEMSDTIEEVEDHATRREAQALARRDQEQQRARDTGPAATSSTLPSGSRHSRRRTWPLRAAPATSSGMSIACPSAHSAPSCTSHGPQLPATSGRPSQMSLPAEGHHHPPSPGQQIILISQNTCIKPCLP